MKRNSYTHQKIIYVTKFIDELLYYMQSISNLFILYIAIFKYVMICNINMFK